LLEIIKLVLALFIYRHYRTNYRRRNLWKS